MNLAAKICKDQEMKPLFLHYMRMYYQQKELPVSLPEDASEKETSDYLKQVWDFNKSVEKLTNTLEQKYQLPKDFEAEGSRMNEVIKEVCEFLLKEHGEDFIRNFEIKPSL
jgi:hypothetical protein